jgi:hypothetical protein
VNREFTILMKVLSEHIILVVQVDPYNPMNQVVPHN